MNFKNLFQSDICALGDPFVREVQGGCCGRHAFCLKVLDSQLPKISIEYYDDEELDIFQCRSSESYNEDEINRFAEVLHTMLKKDVSGWILSLQMRGIALPDELEGEVFMMMEK